MATGTRTPEAQLQKGGAPCRKEVLLGPRAQWVGGPAGACLPHQAGRGWQVWAAHIIASSAEGPLGSRPLLRVLGSAQRPCTVARPAGPAGVAEGPRAAGRPRRAQPLSGSWLQSCETKGQRWVRNLPTRQTLRGPQRAPGEGGVHVERARRPLPSHPSGLGCWQKTSGWLWPPRSASQDRSLGEGGWGPLFWALPLPQRKRHKNWIPCPVCVVLAVGPAVAKGMEAAKNKAGTRLVWPSG